ncbi:trigger factor [[Clostridium] hylemonae]|uniref:trigger factor n=1 Tax=[Clostridium] hylemonae TaxID=89153 RepID=UPI00110755A0|nr:trigger factor [[Clostridium] hylemonae]
MKKKLVAALALVCAGSMILAGCAGSNQIDTDEVTVEGYKGIQVDEVEKASKVTDKDVESAIQSTLESKATQKEITDRAVENGDTVNIDYVGKIGGETFDGGSAEDYPLTIGSGVFIEGFEESVIGHNIGETYDWNGKFPENYGNADYAGKDVVFTITVNKITQDEVPELDDKFVKSVSEKSKTVKEYKKEVKKQLEEEAETAYNDNLSSAVWEAVLDKSKVKKYPKKDVKEITDNLIQQYKDAAEYYQMDYDTFIQEQMGATVEEFEEQVNKAAKSSVKQTLVTKAIADKEKIKLSDDEYKKQLKKMAETYGYENADALKKAAEEDDLKEMALNNLVKDWLAKNCVQVAKTDKSDSDK